MPPPDNKLLSSSGGSSLDYFDLHVPEPEVPSQLPEPALLEQSTLAELAPFSPLEHDPPVAAPFAAKVFVQVPELSPVEISYLFPAQLTSVVA